MRFGGLQGAIVIENGQRGPLCSSSCTYIDSWCTTTTTITVIAVVVVHQESSPVASCHCNKQACCYQMKATQSLWRHAIANPE